MVISCSIGREERRFISPSAEAVRVDWSVGALGRMALGRAVRFMAAGGASGISASSIRWVWERMPEAESCALRPLPTRSERSASPCSAVASAERPMRWSEMERVARMESQRLSPSPSTTGVRAATLPTVAPRKSTGAPGSSPATLPLRKIDTSTRAPGRFSTAFWRAAVSEAKRSKACPSVAGVRSPSTWAKETPP